MPDIYILCSLFQIFFKVPSQWILKFKKYVSCMNEHSFLNDV